MSHLRLDSYIKIDKDVVESPNICDKFSKEDLQRIGEYCGYAFERDLNSREAWYRRTRGAMDLAMQVQETKTFPWQNCSNIIFPLVTIASLQFHARAYPTIIQGAEVVKCRVIGQDPHGIAKKRAENISAHMSWQLLEEDQEWEEEMDRGLLNIAIVGCGFKKSFYDAYKGHNVSSYVHAKDLVVDYWAKTIEGARTKTHMLPYYTNDIYTRVKSGAYRDVLEDPWFTAGASNISPMNRDEDDARAGKDRPLPDYDTPFVLCEQHCWLDLDDDGYEEPYIVTFEESSHSVCRIVARFDRMEDIELNRKGEIVQIRAREYFTKLSFIAAPDGSLMDIGFGLLMGPLNESVNAAINQLFDAGTLSNTAGGFLGRGAKIRGGVYEFAPFSWNRVDSTGDDLRKSIYPLPVREPSDVMFKLLGLIIDYSNRISGTTEINVGEGVGQNTPAQTAQMMSEEGRKIYTAVFKRVWRGLRKEFQKLYQLNAIHLPAVFTYGAEGTRIGREDYSGPATGVVPVADPAVSSESMRYARANALKSLATNNPAYDQDAVEVDVLKSLGVTNWQEYYKGVASAPPAPPDVRVQIQQMKNEVAMASLQWTQQSFIMGLQNEARLNEAKINEINAKIFKLYEEGKGVTEKQRIDAFRAQMELIREQNKSFDSQIKTLMEIGKNAIEANAGGPGSVSGMAGASGDPALLPSPAGTGAGEAPGVGIGAV